MGSTTSKVRYCKDESMVIEASRWTVLQTETTPDSVITHWITLWKKLSEWEHLDGHNLTADPSCKSFIPDGQETPRDSRVLLQLYECQEQEESLLCLCKLCKSTKWVTIIHTRQCQGQLKRVFAKTSTCVTRLDKEDPV